jgi:hypothetical protein
MSSDTDFSLGRAAITRDGSSSSSRLSRIRQRVAMLRQIIAARAPLGAACSVAALASAIDDRYRASEGITVVVGWVLASVFFLWYSVISRRISDTPGWEALLRPFAIFIILLSGGLVFVPWASRFEMLHWAPQALQSAAAFALRMLGTDAVTGPGGVVIAQNAELGPVRIAITSAMSVPIGLGITAYVALNAPRFSIWSVLGVGGLALFLALCVKVASVTLGCDLPYDSKSNVCSFVGSVEASSFIVACTLGAAIALLEALPSAPLNAPKTRGWLICLVTLGGLSAIGSALAQSAPGFAGAPRSSITFINSLNGVWGRSDRALDPTWFGDYSVYNHAVLVREAGRFLTVSVALESPIRPKLQDGEIAVIATPEHPFEPHDIAELLRWVRSGGCLILVGDHTDIHGSSEVLNELLVELGAKLRFDAVAPIWRATQATYKWSLWQSTPTWLRGIRSVETLTPCSLETSLAWSDVMPASGCGSTRGSYFGNSNFGHGGPHMEVPPGPMICAASRSYGKGKVVVIADGTMLTTFALYDQGRVEFWESVLRYAMTRETDCDWRLKWGLTAATGFAFVACLLRASNITRLAIMAVVLAPLALSCWVEPLGTMNDDATSVPYDVEFLWDGGAAAFPPTIGSLGALPAEYAFDTLYVQCIRAGARPRVIRSRAEMARNTSRALWIMNPIVPFTDDELNRLSTFVEDGGTIVVSSPWNAADSLASDSRFLQQPIEQLQQRNLLPKVSTSPIGQRTFDDSGVHAYAVNGELDVCELTRTNGRCIWCGPSGLLSREGLGHCFGLPSPRQRAVLSKVTEITIGAGVKE